MCHADRTSSAGAAPGFCGCPRNLRAARAGLHYYEEPFLSGLNGSGTVFFSGCNLKCVYCQNSVISGVVADNGKNRNSGDRPSDGRTAIGRTAEPFGVDITTERLAEIFLELQAQGAHNINLVTGTPYIPLIAEALEMVKDGHLKDMTEGSEAGDGRPEACADSGKACTCPDRKLHIPVLWNSGGYERVESLKMLEGLIDIWLPDFKTLSPELGQRYMNAPDYPEAAKEAISWMVQTAGPAKFVPYKADDPAQRKTANPEANSSASEAKDSPAAGSPAPGPAYTPEDMEECGLMVSGVCVRHLVIPGQIEDSKRVLRYLSENFGNDIWISLMSQYTPMRTDFPLEELNRRVSDEEYDEIVDYAIELGIENCMIQGGDAAQESFIPVFDGTGIR